MYTVAHKIMPVNKKNTISVFRHLITNIRTRMKLIKNESTFTYYLKLVCFND